MRQLMIICTLLVLVGVGGVYAGFSAGASRLTLLAESSAQSDTFLSGRLSDLESAVLLLAEDTTNIRLGQQTYAEIEAVEKQELSEALQKLSSTVSTQESELDTLSKTTDVSGLIAAWSPYVYDITCAFDKNGEAFSENSGSAVLERVSGVTRFITNRHVVSVEDLDLTECQLTQPGNDDAITLKASAITLGDDHDVAYGKTGVTAPAIDAADRCTATPGIGDSVVMLGYPKIGAKNSITATEGIISGFDEEYYTTSAKIEKGNSGGAAIDVKRNCFLGLPTLVLAGKIESLARILPISSI